MKALVKLIGRWFFVIVFGLIVKESFAASDPPIFKVLDGSRNQLVKDSSITLEDPKYFDDFYQNLIEKPYDVKNQVTFRINESSRVLLPAQFTASVNLRIIYTKGDLSVDSIDKTLSLSYDTASSYASQNSFAFSNAHRVTIKVLDNVTTSVAGILPALVVENTMIVEPRFLFSCTENAIQNIGSNNPPNTDSTDELQVSWPASIGADVYDLEWTYVDSSALIAGVYGNPVQANLLFSNNATRITTSNTSYAIPLLYDNGGVLFFRVRAVQEKGDGSRIETNWSSEYGGGLGSYRFVGHQLNLNWQATTSYAEDGKRKTVVQYYDGSLRSRQTVTKDNTTNTTIVAESLYDYQGRPVIQVMPAPSLNSIVKYSRSFNKGLNGDYEKDLYDSLPGSLQYSKAGASPMSNVTGANQYYSSNNPDQIGVNQFIPNANGYAFTETEYMPDNTGRVKRQSGVGADFRLGSGHETQYYYGTPTQNDLDALFGTEAGERSHYFKNMVRDANGQYSISYQDMHGRTIATALAGIPDSTRLLELSTVDAYNGALVTDTLSGSSNNTIKDWTIEAKQSFVVPVTDLYQFHYSLSPQQFIKPGCDSSTVCYTCLYDLQITISDDCNNQLLPGGKAFDTVIHNFSLDAIQARCDSAKGFGLDFSLTLLPGNYDVTKRLSVSRSGFEYYRDSILPVKSVCTLLDQFIEQQRALQLRSNCFPTCQSCMDSLGTWVQFQQRYVEQAGIPVSDSAAYRNEAWTAYQSALDNCMALCDSLQGEEVGIRKAMLQDVTAPSGQYADVLDTLNVYSIFYQKDQNSIAPYRKETLQYLDEKGNRDLVFDEITNLYVMPQQLTPGQFAEKFKASWANALLSQHPEYCKLLEYEKHKASLAWDRQFEKVDTYQEALQKGFLNPTASTASHFNRYTAAPANQDPLSLESAGLKQKLEDSLMLFTGSGMSLWNFATASVKCTTGDTSCYSRYKREDSAFKSTYCAGDLDMAWRVFRGLYLNLKRNLVMDLVEGTVCPAGLTKYSAAVLLNAGKQPHFIRTSEAISANGLNYTNTTNTALLQNHINDSLSRFYSDNCAAYVKQWVLQLAPCKYSASDLENDIMPKLIQVCKEGSDLSHPFGASSVKPSSTNAYKSFEEVLQAYNQSHGITNATECNPYLITAPKPYDQQVVYSDKPVYTKPEPCECTRINSLYSAYLQLTGSYTSFADYLKKVYQTDISDASLNALRSLCATNPSVAQCTYLSAPIELPPVLQCFTGDICVSSYRFRMLDKEFRALYPGITPQANVLPTDTLLTKRNQLYVDFMNYRLGFTKTIKEYLDFLAIAPPLPVAFTCYEDYTQDPSGFRNVYSDSGIGGYEDMKDVQATQDDGYIMAGSTTSFGSGGKDAYIIKTNSSGDVEWSKTFGEAGDDEFFRIQATADGGYIALGNTTSFPEPGYHDDFFGLMVVKMDAAGTIEWSKYLDVASCYNEVTPHAGVMTGDIIESKNGGYAVLANLTGKEECDEASYGNWMLLRLDSRGAISWTQALHFESGIGDHYTGAILEDIQDNTLVVASGMGADYGSSSWPYHVALVKVDDATGQIVWDKTMQLRSAATHQPLPFASRVKGFYKVHDDLYRIELLVNDNGKWNEDYGAHVVLDVDASGTFLYAKSFNPTDTIAQSRVMYSLNDGSYIVMNGVSLLPTQGTPDMQTSWYLVDEHGNLQASQTKQTPEADKITRIVEYHNRGLVAVGTWNGDALLLKTDADPLSDCLGVDTGNPNHVEDIELQSVDEKVAQESPWTYSWDTISLIDLAAHPLKDNRCEQHPIRCTTYTPPPGPVTGPTLCGRAAPVFAPVDVNTISNCSDSTFFIVSTATERYLAYKDSTIKKFSRDYLERCLQAVQYESFTVSHKTNEYHYTLYYYDQAGNLVKTVPPSGVQVNRSDSWLTQVKAARAAGQTLVPGHTLATQYRYNTLNQVVSQNSPDGGASHFWYDRLGRLVVSQNAKQAESGAYSYTLYDELGRITEVGEVSSTAAITDAISRNAAALQGWLSAAASTKTQITRTVYDQAYDPLSPVLQARNLRNRVAWTALYNTAADLTSGNHASASFYSYDIHGNVDTLIQDYKGGMLATLNNRFKKLVYRFDLISGKVNHVAYQPGQADAFYHRYSYDAENRLTNVETSRDSVYWENEAFYQYYKHGPLARTVLGQQQVQGVDYAYTLQGWLKGVNGTVMTPEKDMGGDGKAGSVVARDAFGFALHYYGDSRDYSPIAAGVTPFISAQQGLTGFSPLFNGNIAGMSVAVPQLGSPLLNTYTYDVLNRLRVHEVSGQVNTASGSWAATGSMQDYKEVLDYDGNGNITRNLRMGNSAGGGALYMDSLTYTYKTGTNQLDHVRDSVGAGNYTVDIDNQGAGNYSYDAIGNLVGDNAEGISSIEMTVYGKIKKILKTDGTVIRYTYDAAGNRISKDVNGKQTWYVRDAQGNVMSVYSYGDIALNSGQLTLSEQHLYGSSRLGMVTPNLNMQASAVPVTTNLPGLGTGVSVIFTRGSKFFELSNHLGNVLATVSDKKIGVDLDGNGTVDYYRPQVVSAQDYYAFGMQMPGRSVSSGSGYRYGFNGKEQDPDIGSDSYDFESRVYDGRLGRWLSLDPLQKKYPAFSPYNFVENNPLIYKDIDGRDKWYVITISDDRTGRSTTLSVKVSDELKYRIVGQWSDGKGHGSRGEKHYHDININFNINIDKNGKRTMTVSESRGIFRVAVDNSPSEGPDESWARKKIWLMDALHINPHPTKQADIGQGFLFTSENVKGQGDPYEPGAKQIDVINNADAFFTMLGKAGTLAEGTPQVLGELKDMPEDFMDRLIESLLKGMDVQQNVNNMNDMLDEKKKKVIVEETREKKSSFDTDNSQVIPSGTDKPDTLKRVKYVDKTKAKG